MVQKNFLTTPMALGWSLISVLTFAAEILLGTDIVQALFAFLIFIFFPFVIKSYLKIDNIGSFIVVSTFMKLFIISQWLKIMWLQAADTHLQEPQQTVIFLFLGLMAFWAAVFPLWVLVGRRGAVFKASQHPTFLLQLAIFATTVCLLSVLILHWKGLNRVGEAQYEEGHGFVLLLFMAQLLPLAVAALSARAHILSGGRRFVDGFVLAALGLGFLQGLWQNQRTVMFAGVVALAATYVSYGGRLKLSHVVWGVLAGIFMQVILFPVIDIQRDFSRDLSAEEFVESTTDVAVDMFNSADRQGYEDRLNAMYRSWYTRLYYGDPKGFLDRFAPNPLGEVIAHYESLEPLGVSHLASQFMYAVPNVFLKSFDMERPVRSGEILQMDIFQRFTNINYGIFAEIYASLDSVYYILGCSVVSFLYFLGLHFIYGGVRNNYFAAFGFSTCYFTFADSDLADIIPQVTIQGGINLLLLMVFTFFVGRTGLSSLSVFRRA